MNVLVACEESQEVCKAFRKRGHVGYSCDLQKCSGGHPEWHIYGDVIPILNGYTKFKTQDGKEHSICGRWDLIVAHPPCTYLTVTGNRWFNIERYGNKAKERWRERERAVDFFLKCINADCEHIAVENPIGYISTIYRKPDQIIQPYQFGHETRKSTCLWVKGLPMLTPTKIVEPKIYKYKNGKGTDDEWHIKTMNLPAEERRKARSKTFHGIAEAMAEQWGKIK